MAERENPAWRAYALMVWPVLQSFGNPAPVLDDDGKPVLDSDGKPKTEWKGFTIADMNKRTIEVADTLYAAELDAEKRRKATKEGVSDD